ncbi:MAG: bifunctional DNA-formamidopyrimidine glycosylase/DNA-(apurinic or apyrimidinic site) lyase [Firmicutes bacterium]|nr:bifunctional DNA-formamidopyrimidine glycosylase/DNA-(apurinic or apyrimidinic site) lyase [Bacillota bacterium]
MPELPEVETVRRTLAPRLLGRAIEEVEVFRPAQVRYPDPETFRRSLRGRRFAEPGRRGKYLLLHLEGGGVLICHLRMSGRLYLTPAGAPRAPHTHVVFHLDDGQELRYQDQRTFGGFHLPDPDGRGTPEGLLTLGPEPLDDAFTPAYLHSRLAGRRAPVKAVLLDQSAVAGLGNIYADESLFRAGIRPDRPAGEVTPEEAEALWAAIRAVLAEAIAHRGTTFSLYLDGEGRAGDYYRLLRVFGRQGQPCPRCGAAVVKSRVAGRGTHWCPQCQR